MGLTQLCARHFLLSNDFPAYPKHATFPTIDGDYGQLSAVAAEMMKNGLVHGNVIFMRICGWFFGREIRVSKLILKYGNERQ